jgi:predicted DNA-binding transcriptional regulator AlpA
MAKRIHSKMETGVLTVREVAEYLRVHQATIYRLLKEQKTAGIPGRCRLAIQS